MDRLSIIGMALALAALLFGSMFKDAELSALWATAAFVMVILGTIASHLKMQIHGQRDDRSEHRRMAVDGPTGIAHDGNPRGSEARPSDYAH